MTTLTADIQLEHRGEPEIIEVPMAVDICYKGSLVSANAAGYAVPSTDAADEAFLGICVEPCDNSGGSVGDLSVKIYRTGVFKLTATSIDQADVGRELFVSDDNIVTDGGATNDQAVGQMVEYVSATECWVDIGVRTPVAST